MLYYVVAVIGRNGDEHWKYQGVEMELADKEYEYFEYRLERFQSIELRVFDLDITKEELNDDIIVDALCDNYNYDVIKKMTYEQKKR